MLLLLSCVSLLRAQSFTGRVTDEKRHPLSPALVLLANEASATLVYTFTDDEGGFSLSYQGKEKPAQLVVRMMGYEMQSLSVSDFQNGQDIALKQKAFKLKEIKVNAGRIEQTGDTLTYSVAGFKQKQDRKLNDVIAKMPGLEVSPNGAIKYQGKAINRFYIEGMDLMGSKYAIAGNNLSADKIEQVQVLQNHQPIRTLRNTQFSDQAALNIVLKEDAKNTWSRAADLGMGTTLQADKELTYDNRLMTMMFGKRMQSLSMYKNNNTGIDIGSEVTDLASLFRNSQQENGLLSQLSPSAPELDPQRVTFNQSHVAATNWLWRTPKKNDLRVQLDYLWNRTSSLTQSETSYTDLGGLLLSEKSDVSALTNRWKGNLEYTVNKEKLYLHNCLSGHLDFDRSYGSTRLQDLSSGSNFLTSRQQVKPHERHLTEEFQLIRTSKQGHRYNLSHQTTYSYLPGQLLLLDESTQHLDIRSLASHTYTSFGHSLGFCTLTYTAGFKMRDQQLEAEIPGVSSPEFASNGKESYSEQNLYLEPSFQYKREAFRLNARLTADYRHRKSALESKGDLVLEPRLSLHVNATATTRFSALYAYTRQDATLTGLFATPLFVDYRTRLAHQGLLNYNGRHTTTLDMEYQNPIRGNFLNLSTSWSRREHIRLYQSEYRENIFHRTETNDTYNAHTYNLHGYVAHSFAWYKTTLSLTADYGWNDYALLLNQVKTPYQLQTGEVKFSCSLRPIPLLSLEATVSYLTHQQKNKRDASLSSERLNSFHHTLNAYLFFGEKWQLNLNNDLYHSNDESVKFNHFLDLGLSYKEKRYEWTLACHNLLGRSRYERRILSTDQLQYTVHRLRPREVMMKLSIDI